MKISEVSEKELLALQAVYRGCNTNRRIIGATYVRDIRKPIWDEIPYSEALEILDKSICKAEKLIEAEVSE